MFEPELWEYDDMAPIFASADIATLVANFQPLSIQGGRPAISRSKSGDHLVNLQKGARKLDYLLRTWESRIQKSSLSTLLGIETDAEPLIWDRLNTPIFESRDSRQVLPKPYVKRILDQLEDETRESCVDLSTFVSDHDISSGSLNRLIVESGECDWKRISSSGQDFICGEEVLEDVKDKLRDAIGSAGSEICDLPSALSGKVPLAVLSAVAKEFVTEIGGDIRIEADHVVYVPANYSEAVEERLEQIREERIIELSQRLEDDGYCVVSEDDLRSSEDSDGPSSEVTTLDQAVLDEYEKSHPDDMIHTLQLSTGKKTSSKTATPQETSMLLIKTDLMEQELTSIKANMSDQAEKIWQSVERTAALKSFIQSLQRNELVLPDQPELCQLLVQTDRANELLPAVRERLEKLENEEQEKFNQLMEARLVVPLHLYAIGTDTILENPLKEHIEEHVKDHFKREVIPQAIKAAHDQSLLREKDRDRQVDKLRQATTEAKNYEQLRTAVAKISKKLKIEPAGEDVLKRIKEKTLLKSLKSLSTMVRGSDILQNLTWITLAQERDGLFISSGKDTTRMIKQVKDEAMAEQLVKWRDMLKAGEAGNEELEEMREAARKAFEATTPKLERRKSSMSSSMSASRSLGEGRRKSTVSFEETREGLDV